MSSRLKVFAITLILIVMVLMFYRYYNLNYTQQAILDNVTNRDGYSLINQQEQVPIEVFIKPDWIPFKPNERKELNVQLLKIHNTTIILDNVWNRGTSGNDIYFSIHAAFNMKYKAGEFLYNGLFNEDGTFSSPSSGR